MTIIITSLGIVAVISLLLLLINDPIATKKEITKKETNMPPLDTFVLAADLRMKARQNTTNHFQNISQTTETYHDAFAKQYSHELTLLLLKQKKQLNPEEWHTFFHSLMSSEQMLVANYEVYRNWRSSIEPTMQKAEREIDNDNNEPREINDNEELPEPWNTVYNICNKARTPELALLWLKQWSNAPNFQSKQGTPLDIPKISLKQLDQIASTTPYHQEACQLLAKYLIVNITEKTEIPSRNDDDSSNDDSFGLQFMGLGSREQEIWLARLENVTLKIEVFPYNIHVSALNDENIKASLRQNSLTNKKIVDIWHSPYL